MKKDHRILPYKPRFSRRTLMILAAIGFSLFCFIKVWQNVTIDQLHRQNANLNSELKELQDKNAILEVKIEELKREERIVKIAKEQLGLIEASKISIKGSSQ